MEVFVTQRKADTSQIVLKAEMFKTAKIRFYTESNLAYSFTKFWLLVGHLYPSNSHFQITVSVWS